MCCTLSDRLSHVSCVSQGWCRAQPLQIMGRSVWWTSSVCASEHQLAEEPKQLLCNTNSVISFMTFRHKLYSYYLHMYVYIHKIYCRWLYITLCYNTILSNTNAALFLIDKSFYLLSSTLYKCTCIWVCTYKLVCTHDYVHIYIMIYKLV